MIPTGSCRFCQNTAGHQRRVTKLCRAIAVADALDAITCFRPYRPAAGLEAALAELNSQREKLFDAAIVAACVRVVSAGRLALGLDGRKSDPTGGMEEQTGRNHHAERDLFQGN